MKAIPNTHMDRAPLNLPLRKFIIRPHRLLLMIRTVLLSFSVWIFVEPFAYGLKEIICWTRVTYPSGHIIKSINLAFLVYWQLDILRNRWVCLQIFPVFIEFVRLKVISGLDVLKVEVNKFASRSRFNLRVFSHWTHKITVFYIYLLFSFYHNLLTTNWLVLLVRY